MTNFKKTMVTFRFTPDVTEFLDEYKTDYRCTSRQTFIVFIIKEFMRHHNRLQEDE